MPKRNMARQRRGKRAHQQKKQPYAKPDGGSRNNNNNSDDDGRKKIFGPDEVETDPHRISQRQKQIGYGKNTEGYARYIKLVPRHQRSRDHGEHPQTPNVRKKMSKRGFQGLVRVWRKALHRWDPEEDEVVVMTKKAEEEDEEQAEDVTSTPASSMSAETAASSTAAAAAAASPVDEVANAVAFLDQSTLDAFGLSRAELRAAALDDPELLQLLRSQMLED